MVLVSVLQSLLNVVFLMIFKIIFSDSLYDGLGASWWSGAVMRFLFWAGMVRFPR